MCRPQSPTSSASRSPTRAEKKKHYELVAALQYVGDALYGVRLHDGA